jgi:hypothetical protein
LGAQSGSESNFCWRRHSERLVEGIVHAPVRDHMSGIASGDERP